MRSRVLRACRDTAVEKKEKIDDEMDQGYREVNFNSNIEVGDA